MTDGTGAAPSRRLPSTVDDEGVVTIGAVIEDDDSDPILAAGPDIFSTENGVNDVTDIFVKVKPAAEFAVVDRPRGK